MTEATRKHAATLVDILERRATEEPERRAYSFYEDEAFGGGETELTYRELRDRARRIAVALTHLGPIGERAIVLLPPGLDYIAAYFGTLHAGWIPVPTFPPDASRSSKTLQRLAAILQDAEPTAVLATTDQCRTVPDLLGSFGCPTDVPFVAVDGLSAGSEGDWHRPAVDGSALALLQYTSGSVGDPKGTLVTHANLLANLEWIANCEEATREKRGVCWLPPYHDMGLIGGILNPLHAGYPMALMPPFRFLKRPVRWLEAISDQRAHITVAPNFAYEYAARRVRDEDKVGLDLSSLESVFNGAEPIRAAVLEGFARAFAPCGFRREAFLPCYGLAEGTLIVSGTGLGEAPRLRSLSRERLLAGQACDVEDVEVEGDDVQEVVGCGPPLDGETLIVDPVSRWPLPPGAVGEVWLRSASVARGYWNRPAESESTFGARLADGRGPFLRTGDTGFLDAEADAGGQLFVVGRLKDLIVVDGQNLYPADVEATVEEVAVQRDETQRDASEVVRPIRPGGVAVVACETAVGERPLILAEVERRALRDLDLERVLRAIRRRVTRMHRVDPAGVVLLPSSTLPKTPNGKLQRRACADGWRDGRFDPLAVTLQHGLQAPVFRTEEARA